MHIWRCRKEQTDRYYIKTDTDSGIVNDPNGWFTVPPDLVTAIARIIHLSVQSTELLIIYLLRLLMGFNIS